LPPAPVHDRDGHGFLVISLCQLLAEWRNPVCQLVGIADAERWRRQAVSCSHDTRSMCLYARDLMPGIHQFHRPISCMVAGSSRSRMSVASRKTAMPRPTPSDLMTCNSLAPKAAKTISMTAAEDVTIPAER